MKSVLLSTGLILIISQCLLAESVNPADPNGGGPPLSQAAESAKAFGLEETHPRGGLPNFLAKLAAGGEVKVAYLGGSITAAPGWRVLSLKWLQEQYPNAKLSEINAAIGGTPSSFGAFRVSREALAKQPDLLFVEFAVNDGGDNPAGTRRAMEGIVRQARKANPKIDICFVYTLVEGDLAALQSGKQRGAVETMELVAEHYGIPGIDFGVEVARLQKEGKLIFTAPLPKTDAEKTALGDKVIFSGDKVHPHVQTGHPLYLAAIQRAWPLFKALPDQAAGDRALPPPLDPLNWEDAQVVSLADLKREGEWQQLPQDSPMARSGGGLMSPLWSAGKAGASLIFRFKGRSFGLYSLKGPDSGNFRVTVDNQPPIVAAQFDSYCESDRWRISPWIYPGELPDAEHSVRLELLGTAPDKNAILKPKNVTITNLAQRDATNLHLSDVLVLGKMLPAEKP